MFSDITELEQEIAQFKDNLQNSGAICDSLQKIHQHLIELSKDLSDIGASLLQSLEASRKESAALSDSISEQLRSSADAVKADLSEQERSAGERLRSLTDSHRTALSDLQAKAAQTLHEENQSYLSETKQAVIGLQADQTRQFGEWKVAAEQVVSTMEQLSRQQSEKIASLLERVEAMDLSAVNRRISTLRLLVFTTLGISACTLITGILGLVLR